MSDTTLDAEAQLEAIRTHVQSGMAAACNDHGLTLDHPRGIAAHALRLAVESATANGELSAAWPEIAFAEGYRQAAKSGRNTTPVESATAGNAITDGIA